MGLRKEGWLLAALGLGAALFFWPLAAGRHLLPFHVFAGDPALEGIDLAADRPDWRFFDTSPLTMFYAQKVQAARALCEGEAPLWNPFASLGSPLLANGQSQPFAPFFLPFLLRPTPWVYSLCILAQLLFGGWGMAHLLRRLECRPAVGAFGALLFAFNPYALNFSIYSDVWAYVWFPWLYEAGLLWLKGASWVRLPFLLALMALGGHLEAAFLGAGSLFAFLAVRLLREQAAIGRWREWLLIPPSAALLSAIWLLPFLEYLAHVTSPRFGANTPYPYPPTALFVVGGELFWPSALIGLAAAGLFSSKGKKLAPALLPGALWALSMAFPFPEPLQRAVTFDFLSGRYGRSVLWFLLVLLASLGAEGAAEGLSKGTRVAAAAAALLSLAVPFLFRQPDLETLTSRHWVPLAGSTPADQPVLLLAAAAAVLLLLLAGGSLSPRTAAAGIMGLALATLLPFHAAFDVYWNRSEPRPSKVVRDAAHRGRLWFGHAGKWKSFPPNLGTAFGVRDIRLCDPFAPERLAALGWSRASHQDLFEAWDEEKAGFLGVAEALEVLPSPDGWRLVRREVNGAASRACCASRAFLAGSAAEALRRALREGGGPRVVFLEDASRDGEGREWEDDDPSPAPRLLRETSSTQLWEVASRTAGWFVVRDLYWPGWKARVDGRPAAIQPADGLFRAVALPPGPHEIEFRYRPWSFFLGAFLSLGTALGLFLSRRRAP